MPYFHVWFATKYRRWLLQGEVLDAARDSLRSIAEEKGINLVEFEAIVDHVHLLLDLPNKEALPSAMMNLKAVSARRLFQLFPELKLQAHTNNFWQAGYGSKIVPPSALRTMKSYIRTQWDRLEKYDRG
jgi:putative transposase